METLTLPGIDEQTLESLRDMARQQGKSVEQEAIDLIKQGLNSNSAPRAKWDREALVAEARRIQAMTPKGVVQTDSAILLREDRDR
ncbi:MAG: hypothetical protein DI629_17070 [Mesorhizobium amorphae]|nr:MAG: hypothetical protein DI629_17070 [Mesorhizobium amorphae]